MIINKPFASDKDPQNHYTTNLHFENGAVKRFFMRGSIAWPEGQKEGFALMAGMDLAEDVVVIFEQFRFWTIAHWLNADGTIHEREDGPGYHLGLMQFIADNLTKYRCCSYFRGGQHIDIWNRYGKEVYMNPQCPRLIELIDVPYVDENGLNLLFEKINTAKFVGETDSLLNVSINQFIDIRSGNIDFDNAALALMTLLSGFDYTPWVKLK